MRKAQLATLAIGALLLVVGTGMAPVELADPAERAESAESTESAEPAKSESDSPSVLDVEDAEELGEAEREDRDCSDEDSDADPENDEDDESFSDRCHGVLSCTFTLTGELIALPFRVLDGAFRFVF